MLHIACCTQSWCFFPIVYFVSAWAENVALVYIMCCVAQYCNGNSNYVFVLHIYGLLVMYSILCNGTLTMWTDKYQDHDIVWTTITVPHH